MRDPDHARALLSQARKDLRALAAMLDRDAFAEEIFGFHAQQAVEKSLKAWLSFLGLTYPRTHDLGALLELAEGSESAAPSVCMGPRRPDRLRRTAAARGVRFVR